MPIELPYMTKGRKMNIFTSNIAGNKPLLKSEVLILLSVLFLVCDGRAYPDSPGVPRVEKIGGIASLVLPDSLMRFISQRYPNLRVPTPSDMTGAWATFDRKGTVPYACWGHFDDKGQTDIALILLGKEEWRVLAFHPIENGQFAVLTLEDYGGSRDDFSHAHRPQEFYIYTLSAGNTLEVKGKKITDTTHGHDSVVFLSLNDPETGILYQWMPPGPSPRPEYRHGLYIAYVFGALSD
jgi:hypothetical protein